MPKGEVRLSMIYPMAAVGGYRVSRVCKKCGRKVVGTDQTSLNVNFTAHMRLHEKSGESEP
jgi:hypothetical protein